MNLAPLGCFLTILSIAVPPTPSEWTRILLPIFTSLLTGFVIGTFTFRSNKKLANINADLNKSLQRELEHVKRDHQDSLASRARRADYLRSQITHLYGPLAFLLGTCRNRISRGMRIEDTISRLLKLSNTSELCDFMTKEQENAASRVMLQYLKLYDEDATAAITLLRNGWGWLDEDDRSAFNDFAKTIDHLAIESKRPAEKLLADAFFDATLLGDSILQQPQVDIDSIAKYTNERLNQKQKELSGLAGPIQPPNEEASSKARLNPLA